MKIKLERKYKKEKYTIGNLYVDGVFFCNTLEDTDRGLDESTTALEIADKKVYGETAIPTGTYKVVLDVYSPKFGKKEYYKNFCGGYPPGPLRSSETLHAAVLCAGDLRCPRSQAGSRLGGAAGKKSFLGNLAK